MSINFEKKELADASVCDVEVIRASVCEAARGALLKIRVSTGAPDVYMLYEQLEHAVRHAIDDALLVRGYGQ